MYIFTRAQQTPPLYNHDTTLGDINGHCEYFLHQRYTVLLYTEIIQNNVIALIICKLSHIIIVSRILLKNGISNFKFGLKVIKIIDYIVSNQ